MTVFVVENLDRSHLQKMFTLMGVEYYSTPRAWASLPLTILIGILIAILFAPSDELGSQVMIGLGYGLIIMVSSFCHGVGHILSSRLVNAPVTYIVETATVYVTVYRDDHVQPSRVHIGRALGGPAINLLLGGAAIGLYLIALQNHFVLFFGIVNLVLGVITLLPIPTLDGAVIWREVRHWTP
jgi:Zn-dependent protease